MAKLLPSLLSADFGKLTEEIEPLERLGIETLHLDVMDGAFVPSISFGFPVITSLRKYTKMEFDVHLMVEEPGRYIQTVAEAGADMIGVHVEACKHLDRTIQQIKETGKKVCVVLNPATPLCVLDYVLDQVDEVLLMTVNPGFGGQKFIPEMLRKISDLRTMIDARGLDVKIKIDGGAKLDNVEEIIQAGAERIIAGSAVFGPNAVENARKFLEIMERY